MFEHEFHNLGTNDLSFDDLSFGIIQFDTEGIAVYANSSALSFLQRGANWVKGKSLNECKAHLAELSPGNIRLTVTPNQTANAGQQGGFTAELLDLGPLFAEHHAQAQKMQQDNQRELIRNLAHEIRNPLGGIKGAAQLLARQLPSHTQREFTDVIVKESGRLQALLDSLLEPHRSAHQRTAVNIHEVLERVRSVLLAEHPTGIEWVRDYDVSLPEFQGDLQQMIQIVLNIARNAVQALLEQTPLEHQNFAPRILLRTRTIRNCTLGLQRCKLALELLIQDNGSGISPDLLPRLFLPLVSGRDAGTGIGLHLAQTYVAQHQGEITVNSRPGVTAFTIRLPLVVFNPN